MPELCQVALHEDASIKITEARLDIEMFLHPTARDRLLDGTDWHPTAATYIGEAANVPGAAAARGVADKAWRY